MSDVDEQGGEVASSRWDGSDRLLRAIEELRALEFERRTATGRPAQELELRVERKAREVFRIADGTTDERVAEEP